jgi:hypothetical protein
MFPKTPADLLRLSLQTSILMMNAQIMMTMRLMCMAQAFRSGAKPVPQLQAVEPPPSRPRQKTAKIA